MTEETLDPRWENRISDLKDRSLLLFRGHDCREELEMSFTLEVLAAQSRGSPV